MYIRISVNILSNFCMAKKICIRKYMYIQMSIFAYLLSRAGFGCPSISFGFSRYPHEIFLYRRDSDEWLTDVDVGDDYDVSSSLG